MCLNPLGCIQPSGSLLSPHHPARLSSTQVINNPDLDHASAPKTASGLPREAIYSAAPPPDAQASGRTWGTRMRLQPTWAAG
ncbi:predicted protein [Plenodomus lingam JN3]|uniref:Uncharacterized protein n=1 Tax=Leptosphaeria maculans (strain JN3 / isolate v23.1.3 / race Av1-4-5-6-7-8) TaxID=985895 RepID=E4ZFX2_LEPMJ|nr:predicted protein [Plenodomus lingam JN3]CBX90192.1 predicted protein [Plenodomus lingam JN3]